MRRSVILSLLVLFPLAGVQATPPIGDWSARVVVDTVEAEPGGHVGVPIRLIDNDQEFSGLYLPLRVASPYLIIDSVSFIGSMMTSDFSGLVNPESGIGDTVEITLSPNMVSPIPTMPATDGLIATVWVTVSDDAMPGLAAIDSLAIDSMIDDGGPLVRFWKQVNGSDSLGMAMLPGFERGGVMLNFATIAGDEGGKSLPSEFELAQNYPNPFNPSTLIEFALPQGSQVQLTVYNVLGQEVQTLVNGYLAAGVHRVAFEASALPSGIYFYRLTYEGGVQTRKMTLVK